MSDPSNPDAGGVFARLEAYAGKYVSNGRIFVVPLLPAMAAFVLSATASVVVNVAEQGACSDDIQAYVIGVVVLGYLLAFYFGFALVGPASSGLGLSAPYVAWLVVALCWSIYGAAAVGGADSDCKSRPVYKMGLTLVIVYLTGLGGWLLVALGAKLVATFGRQGVAPGSNGGTNTNKNKPSSSARRDADDREDDEEDEAKRDDDDDDDDDDGDDGDNGNGNTTTNNNDNDNNQRPVVEDGELEEDFDL